MLRKWKQNNVLFYLNMGYTFIKRAIILPNYIYPTSRTTISSWANNHPEMYLRRYCEKEENALVYQSLSLNNVTLSTTNILDGVPCEMSISFFEAMKDPRLSKSLSFDITKDSFALLPDKIKAKIILELRPQKLRSLIDLSILAAKKHELDFSKLAIDTEKKKEFEASLYCML